MKTIKKVFFTVTLFTLFTLSAFSQNQTLGELSAEMNDIYVQIKNPVLIDTQDSIATYTVEVFGETESGEYTWQTLMYFVKDLGLGNGNPAWLNRKRTFREQLITFVKNQQEAGNIDAGEIIHINRVMKIAVVRATKVVTNKVTYLYYQLWITPQNTIQAKQIDDLYLSIWTGGN